MDGKTTEAGGTNGGIIGDEGKAAAPAPVQAPGQTAPPPAGDDQAKAAAAAATAAEIELKLPEGFKADEASIGELKKLGKEFGLDSAKAQKIFDLYAKTTAAQHKAQELAVDQQEKAWEKEITEDKEFGGKNLEASKLAINKMLVQFDPDKSARKAIGESGLGSHPAIVKLLARVGAAMAEDKVGKGAHGAVDQLPNEEEVLRERFPNSYESMNGKRA